MVHSKRTPWIKSFFAVITLTPIIIGLFLYFCEIKFDVGRYDIWVGNRKNYHWGYGINYKKEFELWKFGENWRSGIAERRIFPK